MPNLQGRGCEGYEPQTCHHNMKTLVLMLGGQERLRSRLGRERCNQHREVYKLRKWPFIPLHPPSTIKRSKAKRQPSFHTQVCRRYLLSSKCFYLTQSFSSPLPSVRSLWLIRSLMLKQQHSLSPTICPNGSRTQPRLKHEMLTRPG